MKISRILLAAVAALFVMTGFAFGGFTDNGATTNSDGTEAVKNMDNSGRGEFGNLNIDSNLSVGGVISGDTLDVIGNIELRI